VHEDFGRNPLGAHDIDQHGYDHKPAADPEKPGQKTGNDANAAIGEKNSQHDGILLFYTPGKIPEFFPICKTLGPAGHNELISVSHIEVWPQVYYIFDKPIF
jgi:hypothetical protein